jgi:hypothetical protein
MDEGFKGTLKGKLLIAAVMLILQNNRLLCMAKTVHLFSLFLIAAQLTFAQDFSGKWTGELTQDGKPDVFQYEIELTQKGHHVEGTAISSTKDGTVAKFEIGGLWDGTILALQEVQQLEPPNARWCLKHIRLQYFEAAEAAPLTGNWEAQGCTPGKLSLLKTNSQFPIPNSESSIPSERSPLDNPPFPIPGKWTGHLSQSDRDYGFYFEMQLNPDGTGFSHIVSDGEGGNATHRLQWTFDENSGKLSFQETAITEESVPAWRWCIKSGDLFFRKEENRLSLAGKWEGYIEGFTVKTGACAPGKVYLEKPVFKPEDIVVSPSKEGRRDGTVTKPAGVTGYEKSQKREVEVERVLEVKNKTIRIRVWDNGTVDGDVCTLFLNDQMVLKNYRVARSKHETIVKLEKPTNFIILHAVNLGSITPNTIAVSVDDGVQEQVVIVSSNLKTSGAIMVREFTVGEEKRR